MAIKSKGRARGRRAVATAPRRPLVVRKPPFWRRPWLWVVVGLVAAAGIAFAVVSILHSNSLKGRTDREKLAMSKVSVQVRTALPKDLQAVPPDVLVIFPSVSRDLPNIGKEIKGEEAKKRGQEIATAAKESVTKLRAIKVNQIIPAEFREDRAAVSDALFLITQSIALYQQVGGIVQDIADLPRADQKALIEQAAALTQEAGTLFDEGYRKLLRIWNRLGIAPRISASIPPAPVPPSPSVSVSPTESPTQTPTETPSATPTGSPSPSP